ncbi:hypothetical protein CGCF245_v006122 [Colletotrichum fructicola]|nr:hypothetical protein CGCF245_v006122 [Colletotrichum fructicola]
MVFDNDDSLPWVRTSPRNVVASISRLENSEMNQSLAPLRPYRFPDQAKPATEEPTVATETSILEFNQVDYHVIILFYAVTASNDGLDLSRGLSKPIFATCQHTKAATPFCGAKNTRGNRDIVSFAARSSLVIAHGVGLC